MNFRIFATFTLAVMAVSFLPSCETTASRSGSDWRTPPRYGSGGSESSRRGSNRFGYDGDDNARPSFSENRDRNRGRELDSSASRPTEEKPATEEKKPEPTNLASDDKKNYAVKIPGKPLQVKLPGINQPISIENYDASGKPTGEPLPPGTAVEIPDPNDKSKKIQFLVP